MLWVDFFVKVCYGWANEESEFSDKFFISLGDMGVKDRPLTIYEKEIGKCNNSSKQEKS